MFRWGSCNTLAQQERNAYRSVNISIARIYWVSHRPRPPGRSRPSNYWVRRRRPDGRVDRCQTGGSRTHPRVHAYRRWRHRYFGRCRMDPGSRVFQKPWASMTAWIRRAAISTVKAATRNSIPKWSKRSSKMGQRSPVSSKSTRTSGGSRPSGRTTVQTFPAHPSDALCFLVPITQ